MKIRQRMNEFKNRIVSDKNFFLAGFLMIIGLIILDQATKSHAEKNYLTFSSPLEIHTYGNVSKHVYSAGVSPKDIYENQSESVLKESPQWFNFYLTYVRNTGAAWGVLGNLPEKFRPLFFTLITIFAMSFIVYFLISAQPSQHLMRISLLMILGGALGNFIDRSVYHYVVDMFEVSWRVFGWTYYYPVFNIADCAVTIGAILLFVDSFITANREKKKLKQGK